MTWRGFTIQGKWKDLSHLQAFDFVVEIDGQPLTLLVTFGNHCFTDEKENGPMLFRNDGRYWSEERYQCSLQLPRLIKEGFIAAYAIAYLSRKRAEQYHYTEIYDYAIFFDINKPANMPNTLRIKVVSAYELDQWGKETLPKGDPKKIKWILSQRVKGLTAL